MKNARQAPQISLRVPKELKEWLVEKSNANLRSLNSEIVVRLEESRRREEGANNGEQKNV